MKHIGQKLKNRREELNLSIGEVAMSTKINSRVLTAIEEGDEVNLPAKTFLRGFIKTYSTYLKLDTETILEDFRQTMGSTKPELSQNPPSKEQLIEALPTFNFSKHYKKIGVALLFILLVSGIFFTKSVYDKYASERSQTPKIVGEISEPIVNSDAEANAIGTSEEVSANDDSLPDQEKDKTTNTVSEPNAPTNPPVSVPPSQAKEPSAVVQKTLPEKKPSQQDSTAVTVTEAKPSETKSAEKTRETNEKPVAENKNEPGGSPQEIIIEALDRVEIDYRTDGGDLKYQRLFADQTVVIKAKRSVVIDVSDGGAINIIQNGKDKGVPGDIGQSMKLKYP